MVRPIDLQDNLSKAPLVGRMQQVQQNASVAALQQAAREGRRQQLLDQLRPTPAAEASGARINPEARRQRQGQRHESPRHDGDRTAASAASASNSVTDGETGDAHIDIVA